MKKILKIIIFAICVIALGYLMMDSINDFDRAAKQCDLEKGYTCSYREVRNYMLNGGR